MVIENKLLDESDVGRWVAFKCYGEVEDGRIKSWNDEFVFVVYNCDDNWDDFKNYTAAATSPQELFFIAEKR